jgi:KDO2-lipid IV(A) lauroyltransferase
MQLLVFVIIYPFLWFISILPFRLLYIFSDLVYILVYYVIGYRKKVVNSNLTLAFPDKTNAEIKAIERKFYKHMCDMFLEMIKSLTISKGEMIKRFKFVNFEVLQKFEEQKRSVVLMCGHYASYEWMMSLGYHIKHNGYGVYMPIANKYFDRLVKRIRTKHGAYLIPKKEATKTIREHFTSGELAMYGLASDQSPQLKRARYWRNFLGVKVPVFLGAEKIAKEYDYPVVFLDIQKVKRGYYETTVSIITEDPRALADYKITDTFTEMLEAQIRKQPEYYLWTHKRFKHKDKAPKDS